MFHSFNIPLLTLNSVSPPQPHDKWDLTLDIFFSACSRGNSEAEGALLHYPHYNLGRELSHIYQIPCLRQGAHCLNKSNTATQGCGGGRPGEARWWKI